MRYILFGEVREGEPSLEELRRGLPEAFEKFSKTPPYGRRDALWRLVELLREREEELARLITEEVKKPIKHARAEVKRAQITASLAASWLDEAEGEVLRLDAYGGHRHRMAIVRRFPIGPVLAIVPFNFPLNLAMHKVAPAVAVGAPFVLKPPPQAPRTGLKLGELMLEAGVPPEAVSVLPVPNQAAEELAKAPELPIVSFTGSAKVGWYLKELLPKKKVILELGGNAGVIVHRDAPLELAANRVVLGAFAYAGQVCISVQRVFVQKEVYERFKELLIAETKALKVGDPLDPEVIAGPLISESEARRVEEWVREALDRGAELLIGGRREGDFFEPTLLEKVPHDTKLWREEVFGPVAILEPYGEFDEAVNLVNESRYGLQAGLFTQDINLVLKAFEELVVGGVIWNDTSIFRADRMPYGGVKDSGWGREGPHYAAEEYTEPRVLCI